MTPTGIFRLSDDELRETMRWNYPHKRSDNVNKVTVDKALLSGAVQANRAKHHEIFLEAVEGYKKQQLALLEKHVTRIRAGKLLVGSVYLPVPVEHTRDYDRILKMIEMHAVDTIDISQEDFARYVMDDWDWKRQFLGTSANYSATAKKALDDAGEDE